MAFNRLSAVDHGSDHFAFSEALPDFKEKGSSRRYDLDRHVWGQRVIRLGERGNNGGVITALVQIPQESQTEHAMGADQQHSPARSDGGFESLEVQDAKSQLKIDAVTHKSRKDQVKRDFHGPVDQHRASLAIRRRRANNGRQQPSRPQRGLKPPGAGNAAQCKPQHPAGPITPCAGGSGYNDVVRHLSAGEVATLRARGDTLLSMGDVTSSRLFYERAFIAGDAQAAIRLGATYDPVFLSRARVQGMRGDMAIALEWYRRARDLGAVEAESLLRSIQGN